MDKYSGLLPFLWKTFKTKPKERRRAPEKQPLSTPTMIILEVDNEDDGYFLHPELAAKSPSRFAKSPSMFGRSPGRSSPGRVTHKRRHSTGLSAFSLPKMLSSNSQRAR